MEVSLYSDFESCQFYDREHPVTPQDPDFMFYSNLCQETAGPILELACGNGRLLIPILKTGRDIDGLDVSHPMIMLLKDKLQLNRLKTKLYEQSMEHFTAKRKYSLIFIAVTSFQILQSQESQIACLKRCHEHLAPGGKVVLDFTLAAETSEIPQNCLRLFRRFESEGKKVLIYQAVENQPAHPEETIIYRYEIYGPDGILERTLLRTLPWRRLTVNEFCKTAEKAGFKNIQLFGTYDLKKLTAEHREIVAILEL